MLQFEEQTEKIINACIEVHNELKNGFLEPVYQEALELEFQMQSIPYEREKKLNIIYNPILKIAVYILYPFKSFLIKLDNFNIFHNINSVLEQERIRRSFL